MYWIFGGYLVTFLVGLAVHCCATIWSHPRPLWGLGAYFGMVPILIAALALEVVIGTPDKMVARIRDGVKQGKVTRRLLFWCGVMGAVVVTSLLAGLVAVSWPVTEGRSGLWVFLTGLFLVALGPVGPILVAARKVRGGFD